MFALLADLVLVPIAALSHHGHVGESILGNYVTYPSAFTDERTPQEIEARLFDKHTNIITNLLANIQTSFHISKIISAANG